MRNRFLFLSIVVEISIIVFLGLRIYNTSLSDGSGSGISMRPLQKNFFNFPIQNDLKYYYEFKPNESFVEGASWLSYGSATYTINAEGLNDRFNYSVEKPPHTYRIVTLGDSFTNGDYVDTPYNYPEQLEDLLNTTLHCSQFARFEVLNLGVGGYDIQYAVRRFQLHGQKYNPDVVLWFLFDNDFTAINELRTQKALAYEAELEASGVKDTTFANGEYYPAWMRAEREMREEYDLGALIGQGYKYLVNFNEFYGGPLVIFTETYTPPRFKTLMKLFTQLRGNAYFFDGLGDYSRLPDNHPDAQGYATIARRLFRYLTSQNVIPCD